MNTKEKLMLAASIAGDLLNLALNIYCFVTLLSSYSQCNSLQKYDYIDNNKCTQNSSCTYYAEYALTPDQIENNDCYLSYQYGYLKVDIQAGDNVVYFISGYIAFLTIIKIYLYCAQNNMKRYTKLKCIFFVNFLQFTLNSANYIMSTVNCAGICAQMALSDLQNTALYIASVGFCCLALLFVYGIARCFCSQGEPGCCDHLFVFGCFIVGTVAFDISASIILLTKSEIFHIEVPLKILLGFQILKSLKTLYDIYAMKNNKGDSYHQM